MEELPALNGIEDMLVCGVWLFGILGDVVEPVDPWSTFGGTSPPAGGFAPAGGYVFE